MQLSIDPCPEVAEMTKTLMDFVKRKVTFHSCCECNSVYLTRSSIGSLINFDALTSTHCYYLPELFGMSFAGFYR